MEPPVVSFDAPVEEEPAEAREEPVAASPEQVLESSLVELWRPVARREPLRHDQVPEVEDWTQLDLPSFDSQMEALEARIRRAVRNAANQAVEQALSRLLDGY
jgi:hypothetical protein